MHLTKHAKTRYLQRIGAQEDKEIIRRAQSAAVIFDDQKGVQKRQWGNIVFTVLRGDTIVTAALKATKKTFKSGN